MIQAIPGGLLPVVTLTMVYRIVPRQKIGTAMGMYGLGIVFAPAIGPTLGGYLVEYVSWRLVFYINVPVAVLALLAAAVALPKFTRAPTRPFDVWGFITVAIGLVALLLAFSEGASWGWSSYRVLILMVGGLLSLALFVTIELEVDHPLLNLEVFRSAAYTTSLIIMGVMMTGMFATLFYIPLFLQAGQGYQALDTGLLLLPQALVMAVLMPISGRLYDKIGPRWLVVSGLLVAAFGSYGLARINPDMTREEVVMWMCIRAAGVGMAMMSIMTGGLASLNPHMTNSGSAINTVVQRVSAALGLAALTAMATAQQAQLTQGRADLLEGTSGHAAHMPLLQLLRALPAHPGVCTGRLVRQRVHTDCGGHRGRRAGRSAPSLGSCSAHRLRADEDRSGIALVPSIRSRLAYFKCTTLTDGECAKRIAGLAGDSGISVVRHGAGSDDQRPIVQLHHECRDRVVAAR